jgi:uncharacterized membrane protein YsdA (DUF1294 family)
LSFIAAPTNTFRGSTTVALLVGIVIAAGPFPWLFQTFFALINVVTFAAFVIDKGRAERGEWRISEAKLHLLTVAGGLIGAQLGRAIARHKTRKLSFDLVFFLGFGVWVTIFALYCTHPSTQAFDIPHTAAGRR